MTSYSLGLVQICGGVKLTNEDVVVYVLFHILFEARTYNCIDICGCLLCVFGAVVNFHRFDL